LGEFSFAVKLALLDLKRSVFSELLGLAALFSYNKTSFKAGGLIIVARSIASLLRLSAQQAGAQAEVLVEGQRRWTYSQFLAHVQALAQLFKKHFSVKAGQKIGLLFANQPECWLGFLALRWAGAVPVPLNLTMPQNDLLYVMHHAELSGLLADTEITQGLLAKIGASALGDLPFWVLLNHPASEAPLNALPNLQTLLPIPQAQALPCAIDVPACDVDPDELAVLIYTSGTTGQPKGVMLSERNLLSNLEGFYQQMGLGKGHKMLLGLPLFHSYGLICALYALRLSATLVMVPKFAPKRLVQDMIAEKITLLPLVPTLFHVLLSAKEKFPAEAFDFLKVCISGGAALSPKLLKQVEEGFGAQVLEGYGLTETSPVLAVNTPKHKRLPASVGKVLGNVELRLVNEQGETLSWGEGERSPEGELWVKGANVMLGYYKDPEQTQAVLDSEGWFQTGDLGHLDAEGNLFISGGRKKDLIIKAGENIAPIRIEQVLNEHPDVAEIAVLGMPHEKLGECIYACILLTEAAQNKAALSPAAEQAQGQALEKELKQLAREQLGAFMVPDAFVITQSFPRTPTGKILKKELKTYLQSLQPQAATTV
jgi:long-chain acyl-CoA synthetase